VLKKQPAGMPYHHLRPGDFICAASAGYHVTGKFRSPPDFGVITFRGFGHKKEIWPYLESDHESIVALDPQGAKKWNVRQVGARRRRMRLRINDLPDPARRKLHRNGRLSVGAGAADVRFNVFRRHLHDKHSGETEDERGTPEAPHLGRASSSTPIDPATLPVGHILPKRPIIRPVADWEDSVDPGG